MNTKETRLSSRKRISHPLWERLSRRGIDILVLACLVALTLFVQGCVTTRPVQAFTVYEDPDPPPESHTISIGTYNLEAFADPEGLALTLGALTNVEVWVFQEVVKVGEAASGPIVPLERSTPPEQLLNILPGEPWQIYYVPVNPIGDNAWEGQAIASRYPVRNARVWPLRSKGEMKGRKRRVALVCEVVAPKGNLVVINTDHEVGIASIGPADRQLQVEDLVANIRQNSSTKPLVLLGDFNTCGKPLQFWRRTSRKEISDLKECFGTAALQPLPGSEVPYKTFHKPLFSRALDHVFLRHAHCSRWGSTIHSRGSDHQPLWATILTY